MKKNARYINLAFLILVCISNLVAAGGQAKKCSVSEAREVELIAGSLSSWNELYAVFQKYGHCDDGAIGEGFSESISLLIAEQWEMIDQLIVLAKEDPEFQKFVIDHIDETAPPERLAQIKRNAVSKCSRSREYICMNILSAPAIKELD
ncbi:MAG: hypothetical protein V4732_18765 [Pseudomonadota bacterium]